MASQEKSPSECDSKPFNLDRPALGEKQMVESNRESSDSLPNLSKSQGPEEEGETQPRKCLPDRIGRMSRISGKLNRKPKSSKNSQSNEEEYEVEKILDVRRRYLSVHRHPKNYRLEYFVKWRGWKDEDNTWEPKKNLTNCSDLLEEFRREFEAQGKLVSEVDRDGNPISETG